MLTITLKDKDGAVQTLQFSKEEVSIGRMDGNDIVLARNNISKVHACVVEAEGKALVVDQGSTNGTYVNGRRITAAHVLEDDDKIYIGDFVIQATPMATEAQTDPGMIAVPPPMPAPVPVQAGPTDHVGAEVAVEQAAEQAPAPAPPAFPEELPPAPLAEEVDAITETPPEPMVTLDPALTETMPVQPAEATPLADDEDDEDEDEATRALSLEDIAAIDAAPAPETAETGAPGELLLPPVEEVAIPPMEEVALVEAPEPEEAPEPLEVVPEEVAAEPLEVAPEEVAPEPAMGATSGFTVESGLGLLSEIFCDSTVRGVHVNGPGTVLISRDGRDVETLEGGVGSEAALDELLTALAEQLGVDGDETQFLVSGTLPSGLRIDIVGRELSENGPFLVAQAPLAAMSSADEADNRAALASLSTRVQDGANIIVCGGPGSGRTATLNALTDAIDASERIAVIEKHRGVSLTHANHIRLDRDACVASGALSDILESMRVSRAVFDDISGPCLMDFIGLAAMGYRGLLGVMKGNSGEQLLKRLPNELSFFGQGETVERSRAWVADAIDLIVIVENQRIKSIVEVGEARDNSIDTHVIWSA